jgi:hypothetical protein
MFYFDSFKHPYVLLNGYFIMPTVSLIEFNLEESKKIYNLLLNYFPSFTNEFKIIKQDHIIGQKKYYSFIKIIEYKNINIGLEIRVLSSYAGGANKSEILEIPIQNYSPSFRTDRIYYFIYLYLISNYNIDTDDTISNIETFYIDFIRNYKIPYTDTKIEPWTVGLFDEMDFGELLNIINKKIPYDWKAKSWKMPFTIERTTIALYLIHLDQLKYIMNDFVNFIKFLDQEKYESENFKIFFSDWEIDRCFSKSGNIHWRFKKIPFIDLA